MIKLFITQFMTILLDELPIAFDSLVFMGFLLKLIHDLDTDTTHGTVKILEKNSPVDCFSLSLEIE